MTTVEKLEEKFNEEVDKLCSLDINSEDYKIALARTDALRNHIEKLKRVDIDEQKIKNEKEHSNAMRSIELEKLNREDKRERKRNWITVAGITVPVLSAIWANIYNWKKEDDGIMSSTGGKSAMSFLTKFKK